PAPPTLVPYTTLFRSHTPARVVRRFRPVDTIPTTPQPARQKTSTCAGYQCPVPDAMSSAHQKPPERPARTLVGTDDVRLEHCHGDRKSTRLNSSHVSI